MARNSKEISRLLRFTRRQGVIRVRDAMREGIHPEYLRRLCEKGELIRMGRGIYVPASGEMSANAGLAQAAKRVPHGVVCLLSALQFHNMGTQSPFEVWVAIDRKAAKPKIDYPPIRVVRFSGKALSEGIESHRIEGVKVKVYNKAKTIADCFKYRNKMGLETAIEALKDCRQRRLCTSDELWEYAKICRVSKVMKPYLEATL